MQPTWQTVIGLEVHIQLATQSKLFSGAATTFGADPNTQACTIDLGLPGVLPVLNKEAVRLAIIFGLAIDAKINRQSVFARKNYFYPDLPKGYQISQYESPIVGKGTLTILRQDGTEKHIDITRAHLEEDAGKLLHDAIPHQSGVDFNRAGIPLLEIVSEPQMHSAQEAVSYLKTLHQLIRYLKISTGNMQEGAFRCDVNISLRPNQDAPLGTRAEIKNINSFRFVEQAIGYEIKRQTQILNAGGSILQETRQYDAQQHITRSMRSKETAQDYRYFPDPDLLPLVISDQDIEAIERTLPELPQQKRQRFQEQFKLTHYDAHFLSQDIAMANYFEATLKVATDTPPKTIVNWLAGELSALLNQSEYSINTCPIDAAAFGKLLVRITDGTLSNPMAKQVLALMWETKADADAIIAEKGLKQVTDTGVLETQIKDLITQYPKQWAQYCNGQEKLLGFFVGHMMKVTKGKANPKQVNQMIRKIASAD